MHFKLRPLSTQDINRKRSIYDLGLSRNGSAFEGSTRDIRLPRLYFSSTNMLDLFENLFFSGMEYQTKITKYAIKISNKVTIHVWTFTMQVKLSLSCITKKFFFKEIDCKFTLLLACFIIHY